MTDIIREALEDAARETTGPVDRYASALAAYEEQQKRLAGLEEALVESLDYLISNARQTKNVNRYGRTTVALCIASEAERCRNEVAAIVNRHLNGDEDNISAERARTALKEDE